MIFAGHLCVDAWTILVLAWHMFVSSLLLHLPFSQTEALHSLRRAQAGTGEAAGSGFIPFLSARLVSPKGVAGAFWGRYVLEEDGSWVI